MLSGYFYSLLFIIEVVTNQSKSLNINNLLDNLIKILFNLIKKLFIKLFNLILKLFIKLFNLILKFSILLDNLLNLIIEILKLLLELGTENLILVEGNLINTKLDYDNKSESVVYTKRSAEDTEDEERPSKRRTLDLPSESEQDAGMFEQVQQQEQSQQQEIASDNNTNNDSNQDNNTNNDSNQDNNNQPINTTIEFENGEDSVIKESNFLPETPMVSEKYLNKTEKVVIPEVYVEIVDFIEIMTESNRPLGIFNNQRAVVESCEVFPRIKEGIENTQEFNNQDITSDEAIYFRKATSDFAGLHNEFMDLNPTLTDFERVEDDETQADLAAIEAEFVAETTLPTNNAATTNNDATTNNEATTDNEATTNNEATTSTVINDSDNASSTPGASSSTTHKNDSENYKYNPSSESSSSDESSDSNLGFKQESENEPVSALTKFIILIITSFMTFINEIITFFFG